MPPQAYNTSSLEQHVLGLHLGAPVRIAHRRDHTETVAYFRPGDVVFMPAGSPVHCAHAAPVEALYFSLNPALVRHLSGQFDPPTADVTFAATIGTPDPTVDARGRALLYELQARAIGSRLYDGRTGGCMAGNAELQARLGPAVDYINEL